MSIGTRLREELIKILNDCFTSAGGDYDPARIFGYGIVVLGSLEFLFLAAYTSIKEGKFDPVQFATALAGIAAALAAAAAGVWIKKSTENPPEEKK